MRKAIEMYPHVLNFAAFCASLLVMNSFITVAAVAVILCHAHFLPRPDKKPVEANDRLESLEKQVKALIVQKTLFKR